MTDLLHDTDMDKLSNQRIIILLSFCAFIAFCSVYGFFSLMQDIGNWLAW